MGEPTSREDGPVQLLRRRLSRLILQKGATPETAAVFEELRQLEKESADNMIRAGASAVFGELHQLEHTMSAKGSADVMSDVQDTSVLLNSTAPASQLFGAAFTLETQTAPGQPAAV